MKKIVVVAAACALLGSATVALAVGDPAAGKTKSVTCVACHGPDGNSPLAMYPKIAGQSAEYLLKQLKDFKSGARVNAIMLGMVTPLSEQDMEDLAAYFSLQKVKRSTADPELAAQGEAIFRGGNLSSGLPACAACHGATGAGIPVAKFPSLAGQHAEYIKSQLESFRSMARTNDAGQMMRGTAAKITDAEISAVSSYIQGLQ